MTSSTVNRARGKEAMHPISFALLLSRSLTFSVHTCIFARFNRYRTFVAQYAKGNAWTTFF